MKKRDELTDPKSCMSRARDDEMTFVLLGRDAAAPSTIRAWIAERLRLGKNKPDDPQIVEAEQCAAKMERDGITPSPPSPQELVSKVRFLAALDSVRDCPRLWNVVHPDCASLESDGFLLAIEAVRKEVLALAAEPPVGGVSFGEFPEPWEAEFDRRFFLDGVNGPLYTKFNHGDWQEAATPDQIKWFIRNFVTPSVDVGELVRRLVAIARTEPSKANDANYLQGHEFACERILDHLDRELSAQPREASGPRELLCQRCHREYACWFAPSEIWNSVIREHGGDSGGVDHFLCPACFTTLAKERGFDVAWMVAPEDMTLSQAWIKLNDASKAVATLTADRDSLRSQLAAARSEGHEQRMEWLGDLCVKLRQSYSVADFTKKSITESHCDLVALAEKSTPPPVVSESHYPRPSFMKGVD